MKKFISTDLDGPIIDSRKVAEKYGLGEVHDECKKNPYALEKIDTKGLDIGKLSYDVVSDSEIKNGVMDTLQELKEMNFDIYANTDNPFYGIYENEFKERFRHNGNQLLDGVFVAKRINSENGNIKVREVNGGKKSVIEELCKEYQNGYCIVDDINDIDSALHVRNLREEQNFDVRSIKVGNNCKELGDLVDFTTMEFPGIIEYIKKFNNERFKV